MLSNFERRISQLELDFAMSLKLLTDGVIRQFLRTKDRRYLNDIVMIELIIGSIPKEGRVINTPEKTSTILSQTLAFYLDKKVII